MAHAAMLTRGGEANPFAAFDGNPYTKLPVIKHPEIKQANLGSFPTPARAIAAGKSGSYGSTNINVSAPTSSLTSPSHKNYIVGASAGSPHPATAAGIPAKVQEVENKLRAHVFAHRIRVSDLFMDFDRLRSNFVSATQFRRCIGAILHKGVSSPLTEAEVETLMAYYDVKDNKMIKWTSFVDSIDRVFGAKRLEQYPTLQSPDPKDVVKNLRALSPDSARALQQIIQRLKAFVKHHGSDVKTWFYDFDKHNNGFITINQFRRGIPANLLSMKEQDLLIDQYTFHNSVNYFKLNTDVNRKVRRQVNQEPQSVVGPISNPNYRTQFVPVGTEELIYPPRERYNQFGPTGEEVEDKIKKHVYKDRIRVIEFFRDYDRHNNGLVAEAQFRAALRIASIELKEPEIRALLNVYQEPDGRVRYRQFSDSIEQVFTMKDLEKDPLLEVGPIPRELLVQGANTLAPEEEVRCKELLDRLHGLVKERHLLMEPFFKDFDQYLGNCTIGRVTRSHFRRLLSTMKLDLSDRDLHILFSKFQHLESPDQINYAAFMFAVDPETYSSYVKRDRDSACSTQPTDFFQSRPEAHLTPQPAPQQPPPDLASLLHTLRTYTLQNRIRISEFFRDADKLRSYSIPRAEFIRGVHRMGVPGISTAASDVLADAYKDADKIGCCKWKKFEEDVERVFGETHLENRPTHVPTSILEQPDPFLTSSALEYNEEAKLQETLNMIRDFLRVRQTCVKPFFKDFDKLRTGYVTKAQFRQTLSYIRCPVSEDEFTTLAKRYLKAPGVGETPANTYGRDYQQCDYASVIANWSAGTAPQDGGDYIHDRAQRICYVAFLRELEEEMPAEMREQTGTFHCARAPRLFVPTTPTKDGKVVPKQDWQWTEKLPASASEKYVSGYTRVVKPPIFKEANMELWPVAQDSYFGVGFPLKAGQTLPLTYNEVTKLIMTIKTKTKTERIRVVDCMADFDHLHHNKISTTEFQRCLKLLYPFLTSRELGALSQLYTESGDGLVSYAFFADEIDSVFTKKGLEKAPLAEPDIFPASGSLSARERETGVVLRPEEEGLLNKVLQRLREVVGVRRIELLGYLEDFDTVKEGTITTNQFRSVLTNIGLPVEDDEVYVLAKKFASTPTLERVDYRAFAAQLSLRVCKMPVA
ncbi:hypothetical protein DFJ77DRAFT_461862 [Powellomyces hirtus]|nr:hypothetical protein DFJ77DRAFT_461862 [Powellomyces hirtus]